MTLAPVLSRPSGAGTTSLGSLVAPGAATQNSRRASSAAPSGWSLLLAPRSQRDRGPLSPFERIRRCWRSRGKWQANGFCENVTRFAVCLKAFRRHHWRLRLRESKRRSLQELAKRWQFPEEMGISYELVIKRCTKVYEIRGLDRTRETLPRARELEAE